MSDFYRAYEASNGVWLCIQGDDYMAAADYDNEQDAQDAADRMNIARQRREFPELAL